MFQLDGVYGLDDNLHNYETSLSGTATTSDGMFVCSTTGSIGSSGFIQSRKRLRYRPGQGMILRFTGLFTVPGVGDDLTGTYQVMGLGHAEDGYYVGYKGNNFGILYNNRGIREIRTLTITGAGTTGNTTVTLNGTQFTVPITPSTVHNCAHQIARYAYTGWGAFAVSGTTGAASSSVVFLRDSVGATAGAYSVSGSGVTGTFALTTAGQAVTETFIAQTSWNGDKLDGTGPSAVTADWSKGNIFQINIQFLGFGVIGFFVETTSATNLPEWTLIHQIRNPNNLTTTHMRNPAGPFTMSAYSAATGSRSATIKSGSVAAFIEGMKLKLGNRISFYNSKSGFAVNTLIPLMTIQNKAVFKGVANQSVISVSSVAAAIEHNNPSIILLVRNATLTGPVVFVDYSSSSVATWDIGATGMSFASNDLIVWSGHIGSVGEINTILTTADEDFSIQPGDTYTLAVYATGTGTVASFFTGGINTREEQ
jgi:hypothetical protein